MSTTITCAKSDCKVASTGVCSDGHTPVESCPFFGRPAHIEPADPEIVTDEPELQSPVESLALPSGEALGASDVDSFLRWRPVTVIAIVGDRDSGKTTLLASIYDRFLRGPFAGYFFAGSRTLVGLEKRSHFSRVDSGLNKPDTPRTSVAEELRFIHFALAPEQSPDARVDLMLSERAGETYRLARGDSSLVSDLIEVAKANRVVLMLDGARVAEADYRAGALQSVRQSFRALSDGGAMPTSAIVQVVTTKIDLLLDHQEKELIRSQIDDFRRRLLADFSGRASEISFWEIAARDPRGLLAPALGVERLLLDWLTPRLRVQPAAQIPAVTTELDRLLIRTSMEALP